MTDDELAALEALCAAPRRIIYTDLPGCEEANKEAVRIITVLCTAVPALLDHISGLAAERDALQRATGGIVAWMTKWMDDERRVQPTLDARMCSYSRGTADGLECSIQRLRKMLAAPQEARP